MSTISNASATLLTNCYLTTIICYHCGRAIEMLATGFEQPCLRPTYKTFPSQPAYPFTAQPSQTGPSQKRIHLFIFLGGLVMSVKNVRVRTAIVIAALVVSMGSAAQAAFAGPGAPPPGAKSANGCYAKHGPGAPPPGAKAAKGCYAKHGPGAPPPGAK